MVGEEAGVVVPVITRHRSIIMNIMSIMSIMGGGHDRGAGGGRVWSGLELCVSVNINCSVVAPLSGDNH